MAVKLTKCIRDVEVSWSNRS